MKTLKFRIIRDDVRKACEFRSKVDNHRSWADNCPICRAIVRAAKADRAEVGLTFVAYFKNGDRYRFYQHEQLQVARGYIDNHSKNPDKIYKYLKDNNLLKFEVIDLTSLTNSICKL